MIDPMNPLKQYVDAEGRGTQARLAKELGVSRTFIGDLVAGRREPTLRLMRRLDVVTAGRVAFADWGADWGADLGGVVHNANQNNGGRP